LEPSGDAVKAPKGREKTAPARPGFARYFEGWEAASITVVLVASSALLAVPRAAAPDLFPVPLIDVAEATQTSARYAAQADQAEREGLPFETRAVGDAIRRLGRTLGSSESDQEHIRRVLDERVRSALGVGQIEALVRLRAVQARLFLRALRAHDFRKPPSDELRELAGEFPERALANGWAGPEGCIGSDEELITLFMVRWGELTHLRDLPQFRPTLADWRRYYRFLLLHPESASAPDQLAQRRLRYVEALARRDRDYPAALARGCLLRQAGETAAAAEQLQGFWASGRDGAWSLRARNYLVGVFGALSPGDEP
jgi:hypothetical protein